MPVTVPVGVSSIPASQPTGLEIIAGRKIVLALLLAMSLAIKANAMQRLTQLVKCSLSVTLRMHLSMGEKDRVA